MLFDPATGAQMQAARILGGATMVAMLAARMFRRHAWKVRLAVAALYVTGVLCFVVFTLF